MYIIKINFDCILLKFKYHIIHSINSNHINFLIIYMMLLN